VTPWSSNPIRSIYPSIHSTGQRVIAIIIGQMQKLKYLPQKPVTGKQKKDSSTPRSRSMFQNHGKTETGQTQRERDKSTVIPKKNKSNVGSEIGEPPERRGGGSLPPAHRSDGTLLTDGVEETRVSASPSPRNRAAENPLISRAAAALPVPASTPGPAF